jgi:hypothetical protein
MQRYGRGVLLGICLALTSAATAPAAMISSTSLDGLVGSAGRIFRGRCTGVESGTVDVAGGRLPATTYTFEVTEQLKGAAATTITFRQVGVPGGGARDLGRLARLPVYSTGVEYVLFLLPDSSAGLTSPAGAAQGAFVVSGESVWAAPGVELPIALQELVSGRLRSTEAGAAGTTVPYADFRRAVLERVMR